MSIIGTVRNGVVVLPPGVRLPEGALVEVVPGELSTEDDPFLAAALAVAKPRPHLPPDYSLNHGHHVSGEPRKE